MPQQPDKAGIKAKSARLYKCVAWKHAFVKTLRLKSPANLSQIRNAERQQIGQSIAEENRQGKNSDQKMTKK